MKQFEMYELTIKGEEPQGSQALVDVTAEFTCGGQTTKVKGFYAGDGNYKVRFYPSLAGTYTYRVSGLMQAEGSLVCLPNEDKRPVSCVPRGHILSMMAVGCSNHLERPFML